MSELVQEDGDRLVGVAVSGNAATIRLSRPKLNPIDDAFLTQLDDALDKLIDLTVVKIRSSQAAFSAGADLQMVQMRLGRPGGADEMMRTTRLFHRVYNRLASLPAVTVAYIMGHALGGGLELGRACDLRIASRKAKLGFPEARMGLLPGAGGTQRLTELCGPGIAARLILACDLVQGVEARDIGLVQWVFDKDQLAEEADRICSRIEGLSAPALRIAKLCISHAATISSEGARPEIEGIGKLMRTAEAKERINAFLGG